MSVIRMKDANVRLRVYTEGRSLSCGNVCHWWWVLDEDRRNVEFLRSPGGLS